MQFLATATNVTDVTVSTNGYKHVRDVGCPTCGKDLFFVAGFYLAFRLGQQSALPAEGIRAAPISNVTERD